MLNQNSKGLKIKDGKFQEEIKKILKKTNNSFRTKNYNI